MVPRALALLILDCLWIVVLTPGSLAQVQLAPSSQVDHALGFVESPDATGTLDRQQARLCYSLLAQRLKLTDRELPHVLVIHASPETAHAANVSSFHIRRTFGERREVYYEFWLVGQPQPTEYVRGFYRILTDHFQMVIPKQEAGNIAKFVSRILSSTVNAGGRH
jgi:hypothetical protein